MFKNEHKDNAKIIQHTADCLEAAVYNIGMAVKRMEGTKADELKQVSKYIHSVIKEMDTYSLSIGEPA